MSNFKNKNNTINLNNNDNANNVNNGKYLNNAVKHKIIDKLESIDVRLDIDNTYNQLIYDYIDTDIQHIEDMLKANNGDTKQLMYMYHFEMQRHKQSMLNLLTDMLDNSKNNQKKIQQVLDILYK